MNARRFAAIAAVCAVAALARTYWAPAAGVPVRIVNRGKAPLTGIRLSLDNGSSVEVPDIPPGETETVDARPKGEAALTLTYEGRTSTAPVTTYIEGSGGYAVVFEVRADGSVAIETKVGKLY